MPDSEQVTLRVETDITAIAAADWDACAGADNPFVSHAFLAALEESGSAKGKTGWLLVVAPGDDVLAVRRTLVAGLNAIAENRGLSSVHGIFLQLWEPVQF